MLYTYIYSIKSGFFYNIFIMLNSPKWAILIRAKVLQYVTLSFCYRTDIRYICKIGKHINATLHKEVIMNTENLMNEAKGLSDMMITHRRYLHSHAETGFNLENTKRYVMEQLVSMGYEPIDCGKAGLVVTAGKKEGKVFLIRGDMDALPFPEQSKENFASANGNMHACGHDMHTAMMLGAAKLLKNHEDEIQGTVKLMFQPAEELLAGAKDMIEAGVLKNPDVDAAMMLHVMAGMPFAPGTAIVSAPGVSAPAADYFEIKVQGKGCHGSMPSTGVDPLNAAAHILIALQEIHARELGLNDSAALTFGSFHGGSTANAIPDEVVMQGSLRSYDQDVQEMLKKRLQEISCGIAETFRAKATVTFTSGCPTLLNDEALSLDVEKYAKELLGDAGSFSVRELNARDTTKSSSKSSGSEDFAYVSHQVPTIMVALAAGNPAAGYCYPQHHPMVRFDETALPYGCALYTYAALSWLADH